MGLIGLEGFMHSNPECCERVNIKELAFAYRTKYNKSPELLVDVDNNYIRYFFNKPWLSGGQMKELAYMLELFLKKLQSFGISVTAFIGGMADPDDYNRRRYVNFHKCRRNAVNSMFNSLRMNQGIKKYEKKYPSNIKRVVIETFKKCKCQIFQSVIRCNAEAAMYSKKNNCFGILAEDTNFVIYNAAEYYFSLKNLNLDTFDTLSYRTDKLIETLGLTPRDLPLMGSFLGENFITPWELKKSLRCLFEKDEPFSAEKALYKFVAVLKQNVERNQSLTSQLSSIKKQLPSTPNLYRLKQHLESYNVDYPPRDAVINTCDDKWNQVQKIIVEEHKAAKFPYNVYQIVFHSLYFEPAVMEDPKNKNNQIWFEIGKKLRRKIYGILLVNKPHTKGGSKSIKEIHIDSNVIERRNYVEPIYPKMEVNLLQLWSDEDDNAKWHLFCSTLNIQRDQLPLEDRHLLIPVASLNYLMGEHFEIASWELKAIISSILLLQYYSVEDLEAVPELPLDPDGINLYWFLMKIFDFVAILNSICGFPLESCLANPVHYQDGKLFHQKYRQAKENKSFEDLCEFREKEIKLGTNIMAMIRK